MIETIKENYVKKQLEYEESRREIENLIDRKMMEIERAERSIQRNQRKIEKLDRPFWVEHLVEPIAKHFTEEFGLEYELFGPFGLRAQVSIYWRKDMNKSITEQPVKSLRLVPGDLSKGELFYETGKVKKDAQYQKGSIGYLNGFNKELKPLPNSFDEIRALINSND